MKKNYYVSLMLMLLSFFLMKNEALAQLTVNTAVTAAQMANALVGNNGVNISNVTSACPNLYMGTFSTGPVATNLGISSGILLTSGGAPNAGQPGSFFSQTAPFPMNPGDDNWLLPGVGYGVMVSQAGASHDACILEFDATPICDTIRFRYVFGSEEYPEWLNSTNTSPYSDAFAFFINGPGLPLGTNIAKLPVVSQVININTVNEGVYSCPGPASGCTNCGYYINNCSGTSIVYDGITSVLTAMAIVQACSTYHVRLEIADGGDNAWDSGVFLEQGTLACTGFNFNASNANAIEGCADGTVVITHQLDTSIAHTFHFTVAGTATNGTDYPMIPDSIVFPPGVNSDTIHIVAPNDFLTEGFETVLFIYQPNSCSDVDTTSLYIFDPGFVNAGNDVTICSNIPGTIGNAPFAGWGYSWSPTTGLSNPNSAEPSSTIPNYGATPVTQQYVLTTTPNGFSCFSLDSMIVTVLPGPVANAGADISMCSGDQRVIGSAPMAGYIYSWSPATGLSSSTAANPTFTSSWAGPGATTATYILTTDFGLTCLGYDTIRITQSPGTPTTVFPFAPVCANAAPFILNGANPFGGVWSGTGVAGGIFNPFVSGQGNFLVTYLYSNSFGCVDSDTTTIMVRPIPAIDAGPDQDICLGANAALNATGSATITTWNWTPATFLSTTSNPSTFVTNPTPIGTYTYSITVTDANLCQNSDVINVNVHPLPPVDAGPASVAYCIGGSANLNATGASVYVWTPAANISDVNISSPAVNPGVTTVYTVTGTDGFNCVSSDAISVVVNPLPVMAFATIAPLCIDAPAMALTQGTPTGGTYSGNGVTHPVFDPAAANVGYHTITYDYTEPATQCSNTISQVVQVSPLPNPSFTLNPPSATLGNSVIQFTDQSTDAIDWKWVFGNGDSLLGVQNPMHAYNDTGVFTIRLTTKNVYGCYNSTTEQLNVLPDMIFYSPSVFTPNGDGNNDMFYGGFGYGFTNFTMLIFDRWGNKLFETHEQSNGWNGADAVNGVYIYKINVQDFDGKDYEFIGHVSLMR